MHLIAVQEQRQVHRLKHRIPLSRSIRVAKWQVESQRQSCVEFHFQLSSERDFGELDRPNPCGSGLPPQCLEDGPKLSL